MKIRINLKNGKRFESIESFIAEEDGELYHSLIDQDGVRLLLQDKALQNLKTGSVFLASIISYMEIIKNYQMSIKDFMEKYFIKSNFARMNIYQMKHCYADETDVYTTKEKFREELKKLGYDTTKDEVWVKFKNTELKKEYNKLSCV
jgi:hypothetical protein